MTELNNTFTDFGIQQGAAYLGYNKKKVATIDGGNIANSFSGVPQEDISSFGKCGPVGMASPIEGFTGKIADFGSCPLKTNSIIEGFSGAFGRSAANNRNDSEAQQIAQIRGGFDKARSEYASAQKMLMSESSMFVDNSSDSGPGAQYRNKFIRMNDGSLGFVTDRNVILPVDPVVYEENAGKNGCNSQIVDASFGPEKGAPAGILRQAGKNPNFFIGENMRPGQSCAPTNINLQVMGATDHSTNKRSWLGCRTDISSKYMTEQEDISSLTQTSAEALEKCRIRAADQGAAAFALGESNYGGSYACYTSNPGVTPQQIMDNSKLGTIQKVSSTLQSVSGAGKEASVLFNGQVGLGTIGNMTPWDHSKGFEGCDPNKGATINLVNASYGMNCNGTHNPFIAILSQKGP